MSGLIHDKILSKHETDNVTSDSVCMICMLCMSLSHIWVWNFVSPMIDILFLSLLCVLLCNVKGI